MDNSCELSTICTQSYTQLMHSLFNTTTYKQAPHILLSPTEINIIFRPDAIIIKADYFFLQTNGNSAICSGDT